MMGEDAPISNDAKSARSEPCRRGTERMEYMNRKTESMAVAAHNSAALLKLPDCVFLQENGRCSRLDRDFCTGQKCSFLTSHSKSEEGKSKWASRLSALGEHQQNEIAKKYYGGKRPWKDEPSEQKKTNKE